MDIDLEFLASESRLPSSVVGIGVFDGVHRAHAQLIGRVVARARELDVPAALMTFEPHPQEVLAGRPMPRLASLPERLERIAALGITHAKVIRFSREFAKLTPEEFVRDVLVGRLGVKGVVVGFNFTFGRGGVGTPATFTELGARYGFSAEAFGPVQLDGQPVSSSKIRAALTAGSVTAAAALLGRPYTVSGRIGTGSGRGRTIGFPTANLAPEPVNLLLPGRGVYVGHARPEGAGAYPALVNIGCRPTFDGESDRLVAEIYLHGFSGDLVGKKLQVTFEDKLRDEQRFASVDLLVAQIRRDLDALIARQPVLGRAAS